MLRRGLAEIPTLAIACAAGLAWAVAAERLAVRMGSDEMAPTLGAVAGLAVAGSLWLRSVRETARASLDRLVCPRCEGRLSSEHEHASEAMPDGLQSWQCESCGYVHAEALTCEGCHP